VGNSHVGVVHLGLRHPDFVPPPVPFRVDTFGAPKLRILDGVIEDNVMRPTTEELERSFLRLSDGLRELDFRLYTTVFVNFGDNPFDILRFATEDGLAPMGPRRLSAVMRAWRDTREAEFAFDLARTLPEHRICVLGRPYMSDAAPTAVALTAALDRDRQAGRLIARIRAQARDWLETIRLPNMQILPPPPACLDRRGIFTRDAFSLVAERPPGA